MKTYPVLSTIDHDQKRYEPGTTIDLDDDAAAPLLAVGAIGEVNEPAKPDASVKAKK